MNKYFVKVHNITAIFEIYADCEDEAEEIMRERGISDADTYTYDYIDIIKVDEGKTICPNM